ncbi:MAG: Crp/Fnr family transcriptional regulator [Flavobacteriales bacterium]|jgi:CRP/FNR family transcriptional regulator, anaerobic regulatory protein|nr:Crp/Fnr family transcriptional regulator [Flavobacteriales bacterium]NCG29660.1 helix-turn-helix domain-containing protein [Bacteroidota bacterium]MBT3963173.1 Crp/Fnr family transcriptional regulator [Flavobacteriales bacterium]MBT4705647.1 Crp/Fnr family transcriptional regulator [Flavobacteriales bacterium]MBT4930923.1 Crp/Fnr family transcriptional regulator [Flavobacteriales bacterium]
MNQEIHQILTDQFGVFEPELINTLADIGTIKSFEEGDELMRTGQYFKSTMLIVDGLVKLYREDDESNEFFVYFIEPGNACALSMVCASQQLTSEVMAKALKPTKAILVPIEQMDELMLKYKSWYYFVLETYRSRFEELLSVVDAIAFKAMDDRLIFYLGKQVDTLQSNLISTTHQEIATDLNTSREVISRLLKKMEQKRMIKLHRNKIEVLEELHA